MTNARQETTPAAQAFRRRVGPVVAINAKLLAAFLAGFLGWAIWPENGTEWLQFRMLAVFIGFAALLTLIDAGKAITRLYEREKALYEFDRIRGAPKGSALADNDALNDAGMR